jgi:hypothetical protein
MNTNPATAGQIRFNAKNFEPQRRKDAEFLATDVRL